MKFVNISRRGLFLQCCHREVQPGGSFIVPWRRGAHDRGLRFAMSSGVLAWVSERGEPEVPGSPSLPDPRAEERRRAARAEAEARRAAEIEAIKARDEAAVKANMARMGHFDVPDVGDYLKKVEAHVVEEKVTEKDIIKDKPVSLAEIRRHNRAVKAAKAKGESK